MNLFKRFHSDIVSVVEGLVAQGTLPSGLETGRITAEPPRDPGHGDISTNAALVLAKGANMKPRELAEKLAERLGDGAGVSSAEVGVRRFGHRQGCRKGERRICLDQSDRAASRRPRPGRGGR
jgi:arginyl-tRNA synthetase